MLWAGRSPAALLRVRLRAFGGVQAVPIPGLELGTLLAASPYGRTLRGFYKGQAVAVKVLPSITQSQACTH